MPLIVLLDDEEALLALLSQELRDVGYEVIGLEYKTDLLGYRLAFSPT